MQNISAKTNPVTKDQPKTVPQKSVDNPKNNLTPQKTVIQKENIQKEQLDEVVLQPEPVPQSKTFSWADKVKSTAPKKEVVPVVSQPTAPTNHRQEKEKEKENSDAETQGASQVKQRRRGKGPIPNLESLVDINSPTFVCSPKFAKFFVIKSYSEDDVHKSIKYSIWTSTETGNKRLDKAYRECAQKGPIYLFFSVNSSGQFCGIAEMESPLDYSKNSGCWNEDKWSGQFLVKWRFIKDIPNAQLRHIRLSNNENKPVTNSRDTQEILYPQGCELLKAFVSYTSKSSILDDFAYYNDCEEKEKKTKEQTLKAAQETTNEKKK